MKISQSGDFNSLFIESDEIKYVRIDSKSNIVITLQNPLKFNNKNFIGFRGKLIGDPTASTESKTKVRLNIRRIYQEEMGDEDEIVKEGTLTEIDLV